MVASAIKEAIRLTCSVPILNLLCVVCYNRVGVAGWIFDALWLNK